MERPAISSLKGRWNHVFFGPQIIGTNEEALYVIDALCHHESDLHIREHYTDTGGSTEQVFALASLLGFRFAPRIKDALARKLYLLEAGGDMGALGSLTFDQVNTKLITDQWNEMRRVASSIRHGTVSASLLMRKLAAYPRQNQVARALTELGRLERTVFLLEYFREETLRRRMRSLLPLTKVLPYVPKPLGFCNILWKDRSSQPILLIFE